MVFYYVIDILVFSSYSYAKARIVNETKIGKTFFVYLVSTYNLIVHNDHNLQKSTDTRITRSISLLI